MITQNVMHSIRILTFEGREHIQKLMCERSPLSSGYIRDPWINSCEVPGAGLAGDREGPRGARTCLNADILPCRSPTTIHFGSLG